MDRTLRDLLEWAKGNRGRKDINPYAVPEVVAALKLLAKIDGIDDYLDVDTSSLIKNRAHHPKPCPECGILIEQSQDFCFDHMDLFAGYHGPSAITDNERTVYVGDAFGDASKCKAGTCNCFSPVMETGYGEDQDER